MSVVAAPAESELLLDAHERASRGAGLLDRVMPGWRDQISLKTLRIESDCSCVVGQLTGSYFEGVLDILEDVCDHDECDCAADYGFNERGAAAVVADEPGDGDPSPEFEALTAAWRVVVAG